MTNITNLDNQNTNSSNLSVGDFIKLTGISVIILLTLAGNILVILLLIQQGKCTKRCRLFIISLACADIGVALFVMIPALLIEMMDIPWFAEEYVCISLGSLDVLLTTTSIYHLLCMTLERYSAISCPMKSRFFNSRCGNVSMLIFAWVFPAIMSFGLLFGKVNRKGIEHLYETNKGMCVFFSNWDYSVFGTMCGFYLPAIIMIICNLKIFRGVKALTREITKTCNRNRNFSRRETNVAKTIALMMGCFLLCWIPFFVVEVIRPFVNYKIPFHLDAIGLWMGYCNSTINPYLYYFRNRRLTKSVYLCCKQNLGVDIQHNVHSIHMSSSSSGYPSPTCVVRHHAAHRTYQKDKICTPYDRDEHMFTHM